jgi:hypothetical protein
LAVSGAYSQYQGLTLEVLLCFVVEVMALQTLQELLDLLLVQVVVAVETQLALLLAAMVRLA